MKFLLAIALLIPAMAQAATAAKIEGDDALRLWSAVKNDSDSDTQSFTSASLSIECARAEARCDIHLKNQDGAKSMYRNSEARSLYMALKLEEYEGRLGFSKVLAGIDSDFEILCSRFYGAEGESFSCSVELGE